jgi:hypothetical protein
MQRVSADDHVKNDPSWLEVKVILPQQGQPSMPWKITKNPPA